MIFGHVAPKWNALYVRQVPPFGTSSYEDVN